MTVAMWVMFGLGVVFGEIFLMGILLFLYEKEEESVEVLDD